MKISAVIIAKNEEKMIRDALQSVKFCNEIIVINNDSSDKTRAIAEKENATVYDSLSSDFSELRNIGLEKSTGDYILYLDADERITPELAKEIEETIENKNDFSAFKLRRKNYYFGMSEWPQIEEMEKLFKRDGLSRWEGKLHESPVIEGRVGILNGFIIHYTHRDFESMLNKTIEWSDIEALNRYNLNHPRISWWRFPRVMITAFLDSYIKKQGFKAGTAGIAEGIYQAFSNFITYAKLWELQNKNKIGKTNKQNEVI